MSYSADAVVIGAGVVGLACARRLALAGLDTVVLEEESGFGRGISSRNSEVIHAGLYYEPQTWKARLCAEGRRALYAYCERRGVAHRRIGKWVVATGDAQVSRLADLRANAERNGVDDLRLLDAAEAARAEPALKCAAALASPSTGIVDGHGLMASLLAEFQAAAGAIVYRAPVGGGAVTAQGVELRLDDAEGSRLVARRVVNAAGLEAPLVAASIDGFPMERVPTRCFAKGSYFGLSGKSPFARLIYPLPEPGGLGVHLTLDLQGQARFGPDVDWVDSPEYEVDPSRAQSFAAAIRKYWPDCDIARLTPAYAGVRPKLGTPQAPATDFVIQDEAQHGVPGLVNLFGIESPGLTCSLAIADEVARRLGVADAIH